MPVADVIVDTIAFDAEDIARYDPDRVGRLITVSSASVYCDEKGRTLDEAAGNGFPEFAAPRLETDPTVAAGPATYSTRKIAMEQAAKENFGERATILRPCAIHGPWSRHPREWWFVKRFMDDRHRIPLVHPRASRFQTTSVDLIGRFAASAADRDLSGIFNLADRDAPDVGEIGRTLAARCGATVELVELEHLQGAVGRTPWSVTRPFVIAGDKAVTAGKIEAQTYAESIAPAVDWLFETDRYAWQATFPQLARYPWDMFDYAAEDALFQTL
ncbi:reductase [Porphyrobacter algicida]|uniref:Reductase n=1 Tax=Qipengyuania algicida TaxID=1836209 RepID=A0A845AFU0_9SPHN|nr:reductase [Qipengyuania algicida]